MDHVYVCLEFNGEWKQKNDDSWKWFGSGFTKAFMINRSIKFQELIETIYEILRIDRSLYTIEITYKAFGDSTFAPTLISEDSDLGIVMSFYEKKDAIPIYVTLKENRDKGKEICAGDDNDIINNDDSHRDEEENNTREIEVLEGCSYDDYFGRQIMEQIPTGYHEHPLQICTVSTTNNEVITGSNPTPEQIVGNEGGNDVPEGGDDVPEVGNNLTERGDGVPDGGDNVPERCDNVPEGGHDVSEGGHNVPHRHFDEGVTECNSQESLNRRRHDGSDLMVGQNFVSKIELDNKLSLIAINGKFEMFTKKSTKTLKEVQCITQNCSWRVRARKMPGSNFFVIRQYNGFHTCSLKHRSINHRQASSRVIGARMKGHFKETKAPPNPKTLIGFMREELKVKVSYWKAWKGRKCAQDLIRGTGKESFAMLPSYCYMLKRVNPGTVTHIEVDSEKKFKYFFMALGVAISGFTYMRKVIGIDAAWIKTKYKGVLIVATTQDSEFHTYPIAWGLVDSENNASWTWFLEKLKELIPDNTELCFISDRHQSILNAVGHVYPMAHHGACYWHVSQNIKHRFKSTASLKTYKKAAEAYRLEEFSQHFNEIRERYPGVAKYLEEDVIIKKWSRAHFEGNRYEVMTTNIVETVNSMMLKAREYPITAMVDFILNVMGQWFLTRRRDADSVTTPLTPKREEILRKRWDNAGSLIVLQLNENEYNVMCEELDAVVNLRTKSCKCRVFDIDKMPCIHAIAALGKYRPQNTGELIYSFCSEYYSAQYWLLAYAETIYPVPPESQWDSIPEEIRSIEVLEPYVEPTKGRPRMHRYPSQGEVLKKIYRCGTCGQTGHNSKKCPNRRDPSDVRSTT